MTEEMAFFMVEQKSGILNLYAQKTATAATAHSVFRLGPRKRHGDSLRAPSLSPCPLCPDPPWRCLYLIYGTPRTLVPPSWPPSSLDSDEIQLLLIQCSNKYRIGIGNRNITRNHQISVANIFMVVAVRDTKDAKRNIYVSGTLWILNFKVLQIDGLSKRLNFKHSRVPCSLPSNVSTSWNVWTRERQSLDRFKFHGFGRINIQASNVAREQSSARRIPKVIFLKSTNRRVLQSTVSFNISYLEIEISRRILYRSKLTAKLKIPFLQNHLSQSSNISKFLTLPLEHLFPGKPNSTEIL